LPVPLPRARGGLEGAETDAAGFFGSDFNVAQGGCGDDDQAALFIRQAEFGSLGEGFPNQLCNSVSILSRFQHNFAADVLNADLYFHSKASQPIKVQLNIKGSSLFVV
jgi:hypothetical protein